MRKFYVPVLIALLLLASPAYAGAAPALDMFGSSSLGSSSLGSSSLAPPDESEEYAELDPASGTLIATSGFEIKRDGFSYPNWGPSSEEHRRGMTPRMMQSLYGDRVCARINNGECVLTATGLLLERDLTDLFSGGRCFGFSAMAGLFATGGLDKGDYLSAGQTVFGAPVSDEFDQLLIRYASAQISAPTSDGATRDSVATTLDLLEAAWARGDSYIVSLLGPDSGHAVTPIALRDLGKGKTGIVVYDNNFPGVEKMIVADSAADTWYFTASINPGEPLYLYVGSPQNQMKLTKLLPTTQVQDCPTCRDSGDDSVLVVVKDRSANFDPSDVGWDFAITAPGGGVIDGVELVPAVNNRQLQVFSVPAGVAFDVTVGEVPAGRSAEIDISLYGDGWLKEIDMITLLPGATTTVSVDQDQSEVRLRSNLPVQPVLKVAAEMPGWSVSAVGQGLVLLPGSTLSVDREADGDVVYAVSGSGASTQMELVVARRDSVADQNVITDGPVSIPVNSAALVAAGAWDGAAPLSVRVEGNGASQSYPMVPYVFVD